MTFESESGSEADLRRLALLYYSAHPLQQLNYKYHVPVDDQVPLPSLQNILFRS